MVTRLAVSAEHKRVGSIDELGRYDHHARRVSLQIIRPHPQHFRDWVFDFNVPGHAVRREVADLVAASDERESIPNCFLVGYVRENARAVYDRAARPESGDHLLRIITESVDAQRDAIVKDAEPAANHG